MAKLASPQESHGNRLRRLRSFCYAAQTGSISRAAEQAMLSQPSVSLQIQALEVEFKARLFQRRGPKILLTPDGQALYKLAWPLVEAVDSLTASFHAARYGIETGRLTIAAGESTILYILPETIKQYVLAHPGIELRLQNVTGRDGLKMLRSDTVDFAVGSMIEVPEDIRYTPAFRYDPMLITARGHPLAGKQGVTIKDVAQYPLILPPQHLTTWRVVDFVFHKYGLNYRVALEAGGWEVIKRYVGLGLGVSIVTSVCLTGNEDLVAIPLNRYFPQRTYGLVERKDKLASTQAARFMAMLTERAGTIGAPRLRRQRNAPGPGDRTRKGQE
jgi:DNA-binding transcriptional LysR family regulator